MSKWRKKPVVVDAHRLGDDWGDDSMQIWEGVNQNEIILYMDTLDPHAMIETREGKMRADLGDWIIKEPNPTADRKFYPCKPDIFEKTYEPEEPIT